MLKLLTGFNQSMSDLKLLKFPEQTDQDIINSLSQKIKTEQDASILIKIAYDYYNSLEEISEIDSAIHFHLFNALEWHKYYDAFTNDEET